MRAASLAGRPTPVPLHNVPSHLKNTDLSPAFSLHPLSTYKNFELSPKSGEQRKK